MKKNSNASSPKILVLPSRFWKKPTPATFCVAAVPATWMVAPADREVICFASQLTSTRMGSKLAIFLLPFFNNKKS